MRQATTEPHAPGRQTLPTSVYLDTQFLFAYLVEEDEDHVAAAALGRRLEALAEGGHVRVFHSAIVLNELAWKLAGVLHDRDAGQGQTWRRLSDRGKGDAYRQCCAEVAVWLQRLLEQPWLSVLSADEEVCRELPVITAERGLRPADACHVACAARHGVQAIVTNDRHFTALTDLPLEVLTYQT
ncbi:MAG: type II toxin-antitoxin system VapC family toxin [Armatimonadetes bacterium]|nr:type II toxin-antitoxin system VapC family toxin [Armatimonadota bacterium]